MLIRTPQRVTAFAISLCCLSGCQSVWRDAPAVAKPPSKVQMDASWFASSGMPSEQIDQLVRQRRDHISAVKAQRNQAADSPETHAIALPEKDVAKPADSIASDQRGALVLEFAGSKQGSQE